MLKHAVDELAAGGKEAIEEEVTVEIQLPIEALIPSFYIPDEQEKISVYQKLAGSEDEAILAEFETDLRTEFGELAKEVINLFTILRLKLACRRAGVQRIKMEDSDVVMSLSGRVTAKEIMQLLAKNASWRISGSTLRIAETELHRLAKDGKWIDALTEEVKRLERKKGEKKKEEATD